MLMATNIRRVMWVSGLVAVLALLAGCAAEPDDGPALTEAEIASAEAALDEALAGFEEREGVSVSEEHRASVVASLREVLTAMRQSDVAAARAALEHGELDDDFEDIADGLDSMGGGPSSSGTFDLDGADEGTFSTEGAETGSFDSGGGTGDTLTGPDGAQTSGFGTQYFPCRSHGTVTAIGMAELESLVFGGIDCVSAGSNPVMRWGNLPTSGPYELWTLTFDMHTALQVVDDGTTGSFFAGLHGPVRTGSTSMTYTGPRLRARGGLGFLVGVVFGPHSEGFLAAFVF
jgi:hypothetical protein